MMIGCGNRRHDSIIDRADAANKHDFRPSSLRSGAGACYNAGGPNRADMEMSMIKLTEMQQQELRGPAPLVIAPRTSEEYVLVRKNVYEKLKGLLEDDSRLMYPMLAELDPEDWEDASNYDAKS
jgi:hypothetical protein